MTGFDDDDGKKIINNVRRTKNVIFKVILK